MYCCQKIFFQGRFEMSIFQVPLLWLSAVGSQALIWFRIWPACRRWRWNPASFHRPVRMSSHSCYWEVQWKRTERRSNLKSNYNRSIEVSAVNVFEALWLLYSRHIWSWFDMNCQRFPNPKTSWWIFPSWGVYILHPATVVFISYQFEEGKKNGQINQKSIAPLQAIFDTIFCFRRWEILIPLRVYMGMQLYHQGTHTKIIWLSTAWTFFRSGPA